MRPPEANEEAFILDEATRRVLTEHHPKMRALRTAARSGEVDLVALGLRLGQPHRIVEPPQPQLLPQSSRLPRCRPRTGRSRRARPGRRRGPPGGDDRPRRPGDEPPDARGSAS